MLVRFYCCSILTLPRGTISQHTPWSPGFSIFPPLQALIPWLFNLFTPSFPWPLCSLQPRFYNVLWALIPGVLWWMVPLRLGPTTLHVDRSRFSVMASVCCTEKFSWWDVRSTLICRYQNKYLEHFKHICFLLIYYITVPNGLNNYKIISHYTLDFQLIILYYASWDFFCSIVYLICMILH